MEDVDPGLTPRLGLQTLIWIGLAGWLLSTLKTPAEPVPVLGLAGLGAVLETVAVRWPSLGFSSAAPACYLALALLPGCPAGWGALSCLTGVLLRTLLRPAASVAMGCREVTASTFPVMLALSVGKALAVVAGPWLGVVLVDVYLPVAFLAPAALVAELSGPAETRWRMVRARTVLSWLSVSFLAVPLASLRSLWLVPVLFGLQRSAVAAVEAVREDEQRRLQEQLQDSRRSEQKARQEVSLVRRELEVKVEERVFFEELARHYAQSPDLASTRSSTLQMALRLVPYCCSAALFEMEEGQLVPVAVQSPQRKRAESARLLRLTEPVVNQAWQEQRLVVHQSGQERIFSHESGAVALPVAGGSILYVGSLRVGLGEDQSALGLLRLLAQQCGEALAAARRWEALQGQLQDGSKLREELDQLSHLLAACVTLTESPQVEEILDLLDGQLERVVPHHSRAIVWGERCRGEKISPELWEVVVSAGRSLLIEQVARGKVPPLVAGEGSLLAVPLRGEGIILLGHRQAGAFTRENLESLQVLALQARLNLQNAELLRQIQVTLEDLKESQARVVQSSKMAAVGQLAAGVAHEVNTPLAAMMLTIQGCMQSPSLPDGLKAMLQRADQAGLRARDIVQKLLYYSREARVGRRRLQMEEVVRDTLELIGQQLRIDRIQVTVEAAPMESVEANQNELQQVFTNLILNARDALLAAPEAPRRILVRLYPTPEGAVGEVRDAGPGIAPDISAKIFDPFFTTKPVGQGTGLGLSVSLQLMEAHEGSLTYHAQQPGSLFRLCLPWSKKGVDDDVSPHSAA